MIANRLARCTHEVRAGHSRIALPRFDENRLRRNRPDQSVTHLHRNGPAASVRNQSGPWTETGRTRQPLLSDGTTATERLIEYTPPHSFAYELTGFTGPLRWLIARVRGEWTFTPDGPNSVVRWTYSFFPRPGRRLLIQTVAAPLWRRYAKATLARAVVLVEQAER
ncbi:SRPBCC family protein [Nocardia sp. NPDC127526]|uniref:SRPBCC family protein n=1 Tax=Nocardia sp. NPDC127526 TaxID=3345393 RepID=UPI00362D929D